MQKQEKPIPINPYFMRLSASLCHPSFILSPLFQRATEHQRSKHRCSHPLKKEREGDKQTARERLNTPVIYSPHLIPPSVPCSQSHYLSRIHVRRHQMGRLKSKERPVGDFQLLCFLSTQKCSLEAVFRSCCL